MERGEAWWNSHQWFEPISRRVELWPGKLVLKRHCAQCNRDFITDLSSGHRYAMFVSAMSFHRLEDDVTNRWPKEPCFGKRLLNDEADRKRRIAELTVSEA
jgi:hypothetical protein